MAIQLRPVPKGQSGPVRLQKEGRNQGAEPMLGHIEDVKPGALRAGLRRALKGNEAEGVRLAHREGVPVRQNTGAVLTPIARESVRSVPRACVASVSWHPFDVPRYLRYLPSNHR